MVTGKNNNENSFSEPINNDDKSFFSKPKLMIIKAFFQSNSEKMTGSKFGTNKPEKTVIIVKALYSVQYKDAGIEAKAKQKKKKRKHNSKVDISDSSTH